MWWFKHLQPARAVPLGGFEVIPVATVVPNKRHSTGRVQFLIVARESSVLSPGSPRKGEDDGDLRFPARNIPMPRWRHAQLYLGSA